MVAQRIRRLTRRSALSVAAIACALAIGALVVQAATRGEAAKSRRATKAFIVKGELVTPLRPGTTSPVRVSVANSKYTAIWIKALRMSISVDAEHAAAGCSAERDFEIVQLPKKLFPHKLKAARKGRKAKKSGKRRKGLTAWRVLPTAKSKGLPAIAMRNLPDVNQDACKGATLNLKFTGKATNRKPGKRKKRK
ncbi:MAG: hypothetical protein HZB14_06925 [Actinobacteria bacterium]|nr:hypothetical protein [Actinomycetota bacterium]